MEKLTRGQKQQIFRQKAVVQLTSIPVEIEMAEGGEFEGKAQIAREVAEAVTVALMEHRAEPRRDHAAPVRLNIKPETFHGLQSEDATRWMAKFERYARLQAWTDQQEVEAVGMFLHGPAELWYLENHLDFHQDPGRLRRRFLQRFGVDANREAADESLLARRQNREETIDSYAYDILSRCHKLGKAPRETIAAFIRGLLPEIKGQVAVMQPQTMEEAERIARTALTYAAPMPAPATVAAVHQAEGQSLDTFTTTLQQLIAEIKSSPPSRGQYQPRGHGRPHPQESSRQEGFRRPGQGHGRPVDHRNHAPNQVGRDFTQFTCHRCGQLGHIARLCMTDTKDLPPSGN